FVWWTRLATAARVPRAAVACPSLPAALLLLLLAAASLTRAAGALRVRQAFSSPSETNNFAVDATSRRVYVGAVNALYQLSGALAPEAEQRTGPVSDSALCHAPQLPHAPCEHARALADNHNKLLALDGAQGVLVACGSVHQGFCELRSLENVTRVAVSFPPQDAAVFPSMLNVAANHANASTAGLVFRVRGGHRVSARLLVAATYTGAGSDFFPRNLSREDLRFENTPEIAIRALDASDPTRLFTYDINPSEDNVLKIKQEAKARNKLSFVRAFAENTYAYVAMNRAKESEPNSVLARICLDAEVPSKTAEARKLTESYVQMGLQCGAGGNVYGRLVSVFAAEPYLFAVFARAGSRRTALCAFRFADVEKRIHEARRNCSSGPNGDVRVLDSVIQGSGAECEAKGLQPEQLNCGAAHLQHPLALQKPLRATPLYEAPGLSSVAVEDVHNHTVVFLGTSNGWLRKLSLLGNFSVANQWSLRLAAGESVHHVMTFDPNDRNYLYLMTTHHIFRVQVAVCDQYTSCSDCLSASDAYCGWCTLESRCSIQEECSTGGVARSWISIREGPQQCPSMTFTPAELSRTNVGILVDGSVPDLDGLDLECDYGVGIATVATVHLDDGTAKIQTCPLPPASKRPEIPFGKDHIVVPVAIKVNGTSVVSGNFIIYDCERTGEIHRKTACTSCLSTKWRCYWDQQQNSCVSDKDKAQGLVLEVSIVNLNTSQSRLFHTFMFMLQLRVEVYSCSGGDSDCSQCWGREQQEHLCAWCENSCRPRDQCQPIRAHCPDPTVRPLSGPLRGGTLLTVQGRNLGRKAEDVEVYIGDVPCNLVPESYTVSVEFKSEKREKSKGKTHCALSSTLQDPRLDNLIPKEGPIAGGTRLTIMGTSLEAGSAVKVKVNGTQDCGIDKIQSPNLLECPSPAASQSQQVTAQFYLNGILFRGESHASTGLDLEEEEGTHAGLFLFEYVEDPQFYTASKEKLIKHHPGEPLLLVINKGPSQLDLTEEEYSVMIGSDLCDITFNNEQMIYCTINRTLSSRTGELPVTVRVGNFHKQIAVVQMGGSELAIIVTVAVCCVLLLLCTVALVVYCTKSRRAERYWQKTLLQMEEMESQIREEIRKGFAELQTDMTDLTKELNRSQGIPFLEYKQFVTRTFFPKMCSDYERSLVQPVYENDPQGPRALPETHPLLQDWQPSNTARPNMEEGITLFSTLLNNKHFLITFVHALEQQKDFAVRDRCNLASLLTIALHGKLEYYTSIMKELLVDLIDASASKNPKLMLRRTESVVEKMLTNWMSICMYSYLKETVGEPFFLLLCAIKQQINKGSIDAITGKARYTLNEEWLLRENIEAKPLNINVSFQGFGMDSVSVRVMNTDTICQVKEKILEAFYKNLPFSQWPREEDVDLEWFPGGGCSSRILQDLDNTSVMEDGRKKLNTVFHYKVCVSAAINSGLLSNCTFLCTAKDLDTEKYVHLVPLHDELAETKKSHRHSHRKKVLPEIYLTRLLSTKGTLQKFLDDLFQAILSIPLERPPLAVKYFFDFLEEQADKRGITDPDTLHIWKTNSLPLRFWVNILKNPQFVFDIDKTDHMDACLSVIAQAFIDACSISDLQLGKDSPTNKLLYAKEIPEYKKRVQCYYKQIQEMAPLSEQEMNAHLAEESRKYRNEFNTNLALTEIYKYAKRYRTQVVNALDSNPTARRTQLQHKFEQVIALVEDNIYECCSEA
uniref:Sema domain-containing protein n=1 Tax=Pygocentrus nattereri TaxID=42514 RepID=A0AAR2J7U4_PYGNA